MTAAVSDADIKAWRAFLTAHAAVVSVLERELAEAHGLPLSFYDVLVQLSEAGGRMRLSDLAGSVLLSRSGLTRLVARMVEAGYVLRQPCPEDGRGAFAVLTPTGRAALRQAWPTHAGGIRRHFAGALLPGEAAMLSEALTRVAERAAGPGG